MSENPILGDYRNTPAPEVGVDPRVDAVAAGVCSTGGHLPNRDRSLPGSCDFHRRMAAAYLRLADSVIVDVPSIEVEGAVRPASVELISQLSGIASRHVGPRTDERPFPIRDLVDELLPVIASVDANAHARGMAEARAAFEDVETVDSEWLGYVEQAHGATFGPAVVALAQLLREAPDTPPALRAMVDGFLQRPVSAALPHARSSDPSTSKAAEARIRPTVRRSGSQAHKILRAYNAVRGQGWFIMREDGEAERVHALTSREIEEGFDIREAHKRTSDLVADGLLEVMRVERHVEPEGMPEEVDLERDGGRVLRITDAGRTELARLDANAARRA